MLNWNNFRVLTFDCYGTLIDWETGILNALKPVFVAHHVRIGQDDALELFGELEAAEEKEYKRYYLVLENVLKTMGTRLGFTPSAAEIHAFGQSVADWPPFPDTVDALYALKQKYKLCVLSNVDDDLFAHSAKKLQVAFDDVITAQQCGSYKPSLNNFRVAEKRVGVPKKQWLHVAQSVFHDIAPAKQFGLHTVWVNRRWDKPGAGATPPTEATPDVEVHTLAELAELQKIKMLNQQTRTNHFPISFNTASILTGASLLLIGFVLYVWLELTSHSMFYPWIATGAFAAFFALPALVLLWRTPWRIKLAFIGSFLLLILFVRNLDWNTRKPFLRGLDRIHAGMTTEQVDTAMQGFMRGPAGGISEYGTISYRHTDEGWGNADIGVVTFEDGLVAKVEYLRID